MGQSVTARCAAVSAPAARMVLSVDVSGLVAMGPEVT
jgi:hypothetical protein